MADFVQSTNVKSAVRELANPIGNVTAFNTIVQSVITTNPFGCVAYMIEGVNHNPVEKTRETYTARFVYKDEAANSVGYTVERFNTIAGFNTGVGLVMANTTMATAHNGTTIHDPEEDGFSATLKCHDPNGEIYSVTFTRDQISVSSYSDDAILTTVRPGLTPSQNSREGMAMENDLIITGAFLGPGLLAFVIIPGLLVIWDRVLDHMEW